MPLLIEHTGDITRLTLNLIAESGTFNGETALALRFTTHSAPPPDWEFLIEGALAAALPPDSISRLLAATVTDTRAQDMADLVASFSEPGTKQRMKDYRERG